VILTTEEECDVWMEAKPGDGHDPRPAFLECREGRAGRRLEVDDPIINRHFSRSFLRHFNGTSVAVARTCSKPSLWGDLQSRLFGRRDNGLAHHHADIV
jgi:hypothetical protein